MNKTAIEWTDFTWNPVTGCTKVSPGCKNCYAEKIAHRFKGTKAFPEGFQVTLQPERLDEPLRRLKPARIFVNSMSDLFHPEVPDEFVTQVFAIMALAPWHTFQVLTKRPDRMRSYMMRASGLVWLQAREMWLHGLYGQRLPSSEWKGGEHAAKCDDDWPLPNVWLGVSVEDQARADERIPLLLQTPAAVRFVSLEPLLGPVNLTGQSWWDWRYQYDFYPPGMMRRPLDWLIIGAETGPGARSCDPEWVQSVIYQARAAGVPVFVKDNLRWPERIQEYPQIGGDVA